MRYIVPELYDVMKKNPMYGLAVSFTVELHRFERDHQDLSKPRILVREPDDFGFTTRVDITAIYKNTLGSKLDKLVRGLNASGRQMLEEVLDWLENVDMVQKLQVMATVDYAEFELLEAIRKVAIARNETVAQMPPIIARRYDERGVPIEYRLNERVVEPYEFHGVPAMRIKGLAITDEEMRKIDINKLMDELTGGKPK